MSAPRGMAWFVLMRDQSISRAHFLVRQCGPILSRTAAHCWRCSRRRKTAPIHTAPILEPVEAARFSTKVSQAISLGSGISWCAPLRARELMHRSQRSSLAHPAPVAEPPLRRCVHARLFALAFLSARPTRLLMSHLVRSWCQSLKRLCQPCGNWLAPD